MKNTLHTLLKSQLKRHSIDLDALPVNIRDFITAVNDAYLQSDADREKLERSLALSTQELIQANSDFQAIFTVFPDMFFRIDHNGTILDFKIGRHDKKYPPPAKIIGRNIDSLPVEDISERFNSAVRKIRESGEMVSVQFKMDGDTAEEYFEARMLPLSEDQVIAIVRNITGAKLAEFELIKSEQQFRTVLESSPEPIIVYDNDGRMEYANPAFSKVFGWSVEDLRNKQVPFVPPDALQETRDKIDLLKQGIDIEGFETRRWNKKGELLDVVVNAAVRYDSRKKPLGTVVTIVDITESKRLEAELIVTKEKAEAANEAKTEFLANMSHELRTPMHAILGFTRLAIEGYDDYEREKILEFITEVNEAGQRLMVLLNDLLDLSKLEVGRIDYDIRPEKLSEVVDLVIREFASMADEKNVRIEFDRPDFDDLVLMDWHKMVQVIRNLLSNAIKFSNADNRVIIALREQSGILMLSIKDFGIGIPEDELEKVFDKFVQSSKTKTGAGGTGLGLSICHEIVKAHQGRIWARNNPEGGVTFFVSLELVKSPYSQDA